MVYGYGLDQNYVRTYWLAVCVRVCYYVCMSVSMCWPHCTKLSTCLSILHRTKVKCKNTRQFSYLAHKHLQIDRSQSFWTGAQRAIISFFSFLKFLLSALTFNCIFSFFMRPLRKYNAQVQRIFRFWFWCPLTLYVCRSFFGFPSQLLIQFSIVTFFF